MKMKMLFWNTHNNENINPIIAELVEENNINIIALAEYTGNINELIELLSDRGIVMKKYDNPGCEKVLFLGNTYYHAQPGLQGDHYSFQIINNQYIICCVHLQSQILKNNDGARGITIQRIVRDIINTENANNSDKTIITGDFNINPFDHGMIDADFFHSLPFYEVAKKNTRTVANQAFKMFYNPMWRFWGDIEKPYGTHYYNGNDKDNIFWNIYDQIIIRPILREYFVDEELKIITETSHCSLLNRNGHPNKKISDHLPIVFEIKEN